MRYFLFFSLLSFFSFGQNSDDAPFQILVAKGASVYGQALEPLEFVDDVTSIDVTEGGFVSLVHKGGTTFEKAEKVFTFYLKPEDFKNLEERPNIGLLYEDSLSVVSEKPVEVLYPIFDRSGYLEWNKSLPFNFYWHVADGSMPSYVISVFDNEGSKIQDFRTKHHQYQLDPSTYGLKSGLFSFKIKGSFAGETVESKTYAVQLTNGSSSVEKASDLVLKALELELSPVLALSAWQEALQKPNGIFYRSLFSKFLNRNREILTTAGEDVELLLSQNK